MQLLILWLVLRCLTSVFGGFVSSLRPLTPIEKAIHFLPPTFPLSQWFDRAFISPWLRWDAVWYQQITVEGYRADNGTAPFHPLYPWLATLLTKIGVTPILSLLIVSSLAGIALLFIFTRLVQLDFNKSEDVFYGSLLFILAPPSFILFAPYPEALFLLFAVLCIYWARKKSWWLAGAAGGLAVLTRQQGLFLLLPVAWELWEDASRKLSNVIEKWRDWLSLSLIPAGMLIWLVYRAFSLGDIKPNFGNIQMFIYSILISPSAAQVVPGQQFIFPWQAFYLAIQKLFVQPDLDLWINVISGILFLALLALTWRKMRMSYKIYSLAITLVSFSFYSGSIHPYMGLPRHLLLAFPIFIGLASIIQRSWIRLLFISLSGFGMLFLLTLYVLEAWVA